MIVWCTFHIFLYLETSHACISIPLQVMNKYLTFEEDAPQKCIAFIIVYFSEFIKIEYVRHTGGNIEMYSNQFWVLKITNS